MNAGQSRVAAGIVACCIVASPVVLARAKRVEPAGRTVTRSFDVDPFTSVAIGSAGRVEIAHAETFRIEVAIDENFEPLLEVGVQGSRLSIGLERGRYEARQAALDVKISMPALEGVDLSGGARGSINGFRSERSFAASLSGSSQLTGDLESGDASFSLSGASRVELTGRAGDLDVTTSGGSRALLSRLESHDVDFQSSGGSRIEVGLDGRLSGRASGGSVVTYSGSPTVGDFETSGGSRVESAEPGP